MKTASTRKERFLPYRYARCGIDLQILRATLEGKDVVEPSRDATLLELDVPWNRATIELRVSVAASCGELLPAPHREGDLGVLIVLRCPATFLRIGQYVPLVQFDAPISYELEIARADFAGSAELRTYLVRNRAADGHPGYASSIGARIADSRSWELRFDRPRESHGDYLDVRYRRFSEDPAIARRDKTNLYSLDLDQPSPVLWINGDHERLAGVLDSRGTIGRSARIREVAFDQIAQAVWGQLFLRAARDLVLLEETTYEWQDSVLTQVLKDVYPEIKSDEERVEHLKADWNDLSVLLGRLDRGLQRRDEIAAHLTKLIEEEAVS